jgi:hypothetical protein
MGSIYISYANETCSRMLMCEVVATVKKIATGI